MAKGSVYVGILAVLVVLLVSSVASTTVGEAGAQKTAGKKNRVTASRSPMSPRIWKVRKSRTLPNVTRRNTGRIGPRHPLHRSFNASSGEYNKKVNRNSTLFRGKAHVYIIRRPDGSIYKVGMSTGGVRQKDGNSIRAEKQVREKNDKLREQGKKGEYTSFIIRTFPGVDYARAYESRWRDTYRKVYGKGKKDYTILPGNKEHLRGRKRKK